MKNRFLVLLTLAFTISTNAISREYKPDWMSFKGYEIPEWFKDAKFGIFIHWGPYCVPAYNHEWYPHEMYDSTYVRRSMGKVWNTFKYHKETYGDQKVFGYKDFIPMFKAEKFNPKQWLDIFVASGAKYIVPVAEHHDGFAMYASTITRWNSVNMGPHRDIVGELEKETYKRGLKFGVSSHFAENWYYYNHSDKFDTSDPKNYDLYSRPHALNAPADKKFLKEFKDRTLEIMDLYKPDLLWFDGALNAHEGMKTKLELLASYYNKAEKWKKGVVYNYKNNERHVWPDGCAVLDIERGKLKDIRKDAWQTDTSLGVLNWGYCTDMIVKSPNEIIDDLIDIISKNGNLLLNIAPKSDGTIPDDQVKVLMEIGKWLKINGEGVYGSRPWKIYGEGPTIENLNGSNMNEVKNRDKTFKANDLRFTQKDKDIYIFSMGIPKDELKVKILKKDSPMYDYEIKKINLLGYDKPLDYSLEDDALVIKIPADAVISPYASVFKITSGRLMYLDLSK